MLQIQNISKKYTTGNLVQTALDGVTLNLRDNEFVAVLGPSGSGKTTLLNMIGGLDRYDSGDLIINGISTKKYKDRDWDSYRNHTVGFVFQSYNLIPHQTVLSNVELALTISGIPKAERKRRAKRALEQVGLEDQLHKRPNQMSGGQVQRVAIARALVNNPDILLADEPTGALDTETSIQVMNLLKEVAKDRLVVMVTHNPELAEKYATRIVKLRDGKIMDDSNPYEVDSTKLALPKHRNMGKSSMSFWTSLALSFNNLRTKKGRTLLTSFAGSIGIIGIALVISLSAGVQQYINNVQKSTMASYPIKIDAESIDLSSLIKDQSKSGKPDREKISHGLDAVYSDNRALERASTVTKSITKNDLTKFKKYLDSPTSPINRYVGENGIIYSYDTKFDVYSYDSKGTLVNADGSTLVSADTSGKATNLVSGQKSATSTKLMSGIMTGTNTASPFSELLPGNGNTLVGKVLTDNYKVLYGSWPQKYNEVVLVLDENNEVPISVLYELGYLPSADYKDIVKKIDNGESVSLSTKTFSYQDLCGQTFYMLPSCDTYEKNSHGTFDPIASDNEKLKDSLKNAVKLKISGIVRPIQKSDSNFISGNVGYTRALINYIINHTDSSTVVKAQKTTPEINVLNGTAFSPADDSKKISDIKLYLSNLGVSEKAKAFQKIMQSSGKASASLLAKSESEQAALLDQYLKNPDRSVMLKLYESTIPSSSYNDNMSAFGVVSLDAPSSISIYTDSFQNKDKIADCIKEYNASAASGDQITYTDYVALLMSSVTNIINVISYILIAFVAVSLIVSSIMIGIITYISVLERTKEIGILRAIGASRRNISQVFNAETFIIGLCSGIIGIILSLLLLIPGNILLHRATGLTEVNAFLPINSAALLILISVALTLVGGLIPACKAAKKDPVTALRTE